MSESSTYTLADRPRWVVPKIFKAISLLSFLLALSHLSYWIWTWIEYYSDEYADPHALIFNLNHVLLQSGYILLGGSILWVLALIVDQLNKLVWLNATDEDRAAIIAKRGKKRSKTQLVD